MASYQLLEASLFTAKERRLGLSFLRNGAPQIDLRFFYVFAIVLGDMYLDAVEQFRIQRLDGCAGIAPARRPKLLNEDCKNCLLSRRSPEESNRLFCPGMVLVGFGQVRKIDDRGRWGISNFVSVQSGHFDAQRAWSTETQRVTLKSSLHGFVRPKA